jgi:hypothetical protein
MEEFGIPRAEVLRAATSEPAAALRQIGEFGSVATGMRADLVLLGSDPMQNLNAYRDNRGTVVRGIYLDRVALQGALTRLAEIEAEPDSLYRIDKRTMNDLVKDVENLAARHIVLDTSYLIPAVRSLGQLGYASKAAALKATILDFRMGPCAEILPGGGETPDQQGQ